MTIVAPAPTHPERTARPRRFAMCPPRFFAVTYEINPWMDMATPVDVDLAGRQWTAIRRTYERLGHDVELIDPVAGLPDLVFSANAGLVLDGRVLVSRFRHVERRGEEAVFADWFAGHGLEVVLAQRWNEGEGDLLVTHDASGEVILAGTGFRTDRDAHAEVAAVFDRPVVPLELVDPRWYHLDTALAVLDDLAGTIAYHPGAFSVRSRAELAERFPDAILVGEHDALAFGLNAASDGHHVIVAAGVRRFAAQLAERGFEPILLDTSELQKAGGSVKCATLEVRR